MTISPMQRNAIAEFVNSHHISRGLGNKEAACSIAAINLALTGVLTDKIPNCMSLVIGEWIIGIQDPMPDAIRNSDKWRELLPPAAGTGRDYEEQREAILHEWMWGTVLPRLQPLAAHYGFGFEWETMVANRTLGSTIMDANSAEGYSWLCEAAAYAVEAIKTPWMTAMVARYGARATAMVARYGARATSMVASDGARATAMTIKDFEAAKAAEAAYWAVIDPTNVLAKLVEVGGTK